MVGRGFSNRPILRCSGDWWTRPMMSATPVTAAADECSAHAAAQAAAPHAVEHGAAAPGSSSTLSLGGTSTPTATAAMVSKPARKTLRGSFDKTRVLEEGGKKTELDKYLTEDVESNDDKFDILEWWKNNSSRFPILSILAKDILAIPITSVSSESAFSTGGRVLNDFRSALLPTTVEALVCTQSWIRGTASVSGFEEVLHENEEVEQDLIRYATQATE